MTSPGDSPIKEGSINPKIITPKNGSEDSEKQGRNVVPNFRLPNHEPRRISFLGLETNPFRNQEQPDGSKSNVQRNYDDFFSKQEIILEETPRDVTSRKLDKSVDSAMSDAENFNQLVETIEGLSKKKQNYILKRMTTPTKIK